MKLLVLIFTWVIAINSSAFAESSSDSKRVSDWRFGVGLGYSPLLTLNLKGTDTEAGTGNTYHNIVELEYKGSAAFSLTAWRTPQNSWGFVSGYEYTGQRELKKVTVNGLSSTNIQSSSKYQVQNVYVGTAYRWENLFIPLALNYTFVFFQPAPLSVGTVEVKNGVGAHLGLGWFLGDNFVIEFLGRSALTELNMSDSTGTSKNEGTIASSSLLLSFQY
ncbi:hypothetical protein [Bdellovibrio sp. HCB274]|uniref:hypothetical protein n=1 Tax=Bdellovibrio sp. HCB274 TaxID=3394361 RepID=UPI0039B4AE67